MYMCSHYNVACRLPSVLLIFALNTAYNVNVYGVSYECIDFDNKLLQWIRSFDVTIYNVNTISFCRHCAHI